jgi:hypothetical protein
MTFVKFDAFPYGYLPLGGPPRPPRPPTAGA